MKKVSILRHGIFLAAAITALWVITATAQSLVVTGNVISGQPLTLRSTFGPVKIDGVLDIGYEIVTDEHTSDGGFESEGVACPADKKVLGGGCFASGNSDDQLDGSHPTGDSGWSCTWTDTQSDHTVRAYAICARVI